VNESAVSVLAISGQYGSRVPTVARAVSRRFGFELFDDELLRRIADASGTSKAEADLYNRLDAGRVHALVSSLAWPVDAALTAGELPAGTERVVVRETANVVHAIAANGRAVICGRGAAWLLSRHAGVLAVHLVGAERDRVRVVAEGHESLDLDAVDNSSSAADLVRRTDRSRAQYIRRFHGGWVDDAAAYHMTIDSLALGWDVAVSLIAHAAARPGTHGGEPREHP
jgi:cytidylate kinase